MSAVECPSSEQGVTVDVINCSLILRRTRTLKDFPRELLYLRVNDVADEEIFDPLITAFKVTTKFQMPNPVTNSIIQNKLYLPLI